MGQMGFELPEVDRKQTKEAVEGALERYRIYKFLSFEEREATITASYDDTPRSNTDVTSDQTAKIAIFNVDAQAARKAHIEQVERAVNRLPRMEKFLIMERYMTSEADYLTDQNVYNHKFNPPISQGKYDKIRWKAFYKLAFFMELVVVKKREDGGAS
ncbi:phage transcriptional regulator, ArpU family [Paenibacillus sp. UNCCL117]|uniref:ArpU family phage packaging/lysis transcriptional regulator n=1 Tax=unclassified Paenibacillus TaxID=185978 RepID=UPI00088B4B20|nr:MULTISPECIES: ArpU family phage packaging/lysis transcriptional regulator [unclassified Paenibacillus]SDD27611.1 phage transcriptional regulator, ArpU family [Paenibacillus sp. cl123]SFW41055.1 phage transcriptional regulator, ArpU family [Paenibacillus sp. UNCCL117]